MKSGAVTGKWSKPGRGANEAFDLMVYAEALVILHGYEKIRWPDAPEWASRETWLECVPDSTEPSPTPEPVSTPVKKRRRRKKTVTDDVNPWLSFRRMVMNQNDIEAMIQRYTEAEMAVLDGKSVTFNGQQMTMENLSEIRQGRQEWERRLAALITRRRGHPPGTGWRGSDGNS